MNGGKGIRLDVPIIGEQIDRAAIKAVEEILAKLKSGEIVSVAICGERKDNGQMTMAVSIHRGDPVRLRGAIGMMQTMVDHQIFGKG